jgi:rhodanese-related sulfurtransferase
MKFVLDNWMLIAVMAASGAMLLWPFIQNRISPVKDVGNAEATLLVNRSDAIFLDVREPKEYTGGHLPNAIHIPLSQLDARAGELAKLTARPVVAYCDSGRRSRGAAAALTRAGFKDVYSLHGGIFGWKKDGLPVEK